MVGKLLTGFSYSFITSQYVTLLGEWRLFASFYFSVNDKGLLLDYQGTYRDCSSCGFGEEDVRVLLEDDGGAFSRRITNDDIESYNTLLLHKEK